MRLVAFIIRTVWLLSNKAAGFIGNILILESTPYVLLQRPNTKQHNIGILLQGFCKVREHNTYSLSHS